MWSKVRGNVFRVVCFSILIAAACVFGFQKSFADGSPFAIANVEISQKSDTATGGITGYDGGKINNNVTFHKVGDSVTYKITIKNVSGTAQSIDNVSSDYQGELFDYEFNSYAGDVVEAGDSFDFVLKATYANAVSDINKRQQNLETKLVFKFSDGGEMTIVIANPSTWDNISVFGAIIASCVIVLLVIIIFRMRKIDAGKKVIMIGVLLVIACLPLPFVEAADGLYDVEVASNYTLNDELVVSYLSSDGSDELDTKIVKYDEKTSEVDAPSVTGYYFNNWVTADGVPFDFETPVTDDLALYTDYAPYVYTVHFDENGGYSYGGRASNEQSITYDQAEALWGNVFRRDGYDFVGWNTRSDGLGRSFADKEEVLNLRDDDGEYKLYAIWKARTDTPYTVIDKLMTVDGGGYVAMPERHLTGETDKEASPEPLELDGFKQPERQSAVVTGDGEMVIEYYYDRVEKKLTINDAEYVESSHASGKYNYGTEITLKAKKRDEYIFEKWTNGSTDKEITITLNEDITIGPVYRDTDFPIVFSHEGACTFNGIQGTNKGNDGLLESDNITGADCADYAGVTYIDTGVQLYTESNIHKDFVIEFTIDEFDLSKNGDRATLLNSTFENSSAAFPGIVVRRNDNQDKLLIGVNVVKDKKKTVDSKIYFEPISSVSKVRIMRKNDAICYAINDEAPVYVGDNSPHNYYFDAPSVMFGASLDYKTPSSPELYRFFNGTLSGMKIRLGTDVDDTLNCEKP